MVRWIPELIWDDSNVAHIALHDVTTDECEDVRDNARWFRRKGDRYLLIGTTQSGRKVTVLLALDGYVITARPAKGWELKHARDGK